MPSFVGLVVRVLDPCSSPRACSMRTGGWDWGSHVPAWPVTAFPAKAGNPSFARWRRAVALVKSSRSRPVTISKTCLTGYRTPKTNTAWLRTGSGRTPFIFASTARRDREMFSPLATNWMLSITNNHIINTTIIKARGSALAAVRGARRAQEGCGRPGLCAAGELDR